MSDAFVFGGQQYHRAQRLGEGSFGAVLTVYDDDGQVYALKDFAEEEVEEDCAGVDCGVLREVCTLRLLRDQFGHRNILRITDCTIEDGNIGLVMPKLGMNLKDAITAKILDRAGNIRVAYGLLSALTHMHHNGFIHRDVKLENIMLDESNEAILIDFSLAKIVASECAGSERTHTPDIGTACYIAPEVYHKQPYGFKADAYSSGVVLLQLITGQLLQTERDKVAFTMVQQLKDKLPEKKPMPTLLRALLETESESRCTCEEALSMDVFRKNGHEYTPAKPIVMDALLAFAKPGQADQSSGNQCKRKRGDKKDTGGCNNSKLSQMCGAIEIESEQTVHAARTYINAVPTVEPAYCLFLAAKMYELEQPGVEFAAEELAAFTASGEFCVDEYAEAELAVLKATDFMLWTTPVPVKDEKRKKK
jgi:serine/threonine protein kinase